MRAKRPYSTEVAMFLIFLTQPLIFASALSMAGLGGDTDQILMESRNVWPGPQRAAVVCNYGWNRARVEALAERLGAGSTLYVIDLHHVDGLGKACNLVRAAQPQFVVLLPRDPVVRDGSLAATIMIRTLNQVGIPTLATTSLALAQGAAAAKGPGTSDVLLINDQPAGSVTINWKETHPIRTSEIAPRTRSRATITMLNAR